MTDYKIFDAFKKIGNVSEFFQIFGSAELASEHPLAAAIVKYARDMVKLTQPEKFEVGIYSLHNLISSSVFQVKEFSVNSQVIEY